MRRGTPRASNGSPLPLSSPPSKTAGTRLPRERAPCSVRNNRVSPSCPALVAHRDLFEHTYAYARQDRLSSLGSFYLGGRSSHDIFPHVHTRAYTDTRQNHLRSAVVSPNARLRRCRSSRVFFLRPADVNVRTRVCSCARGRERRAG